MIPLIDLKAQHYSIKRELDEAINSVIEKSQFIGGNELKRFEKDFASYCGKELCVGASSGSTALYSVLKCLGIKEGDEVVMPVNTFIATAFAVTLCGAKPVFVDVNEADALIDVNLVEKAITEKTKAIIPVHLYGNVCDMNKIIEIASNHGLQIIEDCAQAHGSEWDGKRVPVTEIGCFSFFPAKSLGAMGDAGAIVCDNAKFAERCRKFVNHGRAEKYFHDIEGFNFRLDNLQATILNVKLKHLDRWIDCKNKLAKIYDQRLNNSLGKFSKHEDTRHSFYMYVIKAKNRADLQKHLKGEAIETGVHYPVPLHLQPALSYLGYKDSDFPVAERIAREILSIPMYTELTKSDQNKVIEAINNFSN